MTAREIIKEFEGLRLTAYRCPAGVLTIGYGHTREVHEGQQITEEEAEQLLHEDYDRAATFVRQLAFKPLNRNQTEACISFVFNLGPGNFKNSTLLRKINVDPNDPSIRAEFAKWVKSNFETLPGLVKRRAAEAELYFTPC
jgi:lysozyme